MRRLFIVVLGLFQAIVLVMLWLASLVTNWILLSLGSDERRRTPPSTERYWHRVGQAAQEIICWLKGRELHG